MSDRPAQQPGADAAPVGASGGSALPGAVLGAGGPRPAAVPAADPDLLVRQAAQAGITLERARAARLAAPLTSVIEGVRGATPLRRDQLAPALVFRVPREV
jgi:hypothetical protein